MGARTASVYHAFAMPLMAAHMVIAAYVVGGFLVASVYAVGMLRGRRDRYHRQLRPAARTPD